MKDLESRIIKLEERIKAKSKHEVQSNTPGITEEELPQLLKILADAHGFPAGSDEDLQRFAEWYINRHEQRDHEKVDDEVRE